MVRNIFFLKALSVFLGTVIGVGIFGLPFVAFKAGFFVVICYFLLMTFFAILVHFLYGEVVLGTKRLYRLTGFVGEYLGEKWKKITFFIVTIGLLGSLLAYLIIGGQFLSLSLGSYLGGNSVLYTLLFFMLGAYLVFRDIKSISGVELSLLFLLFLILVIFFIKAIPVININYFKAVNLKFLPLPYGVVLFSLWGSALIPEVEEMLTASGKRKGKEIKRDLRRVIFWGITLSAVVYLFFIFIILGASGPQTSEEAISGLEKILDSNIVKLGFIFGVITCFTSFITLALTLKKVFWYDFGLSRNLSWGLTCFLPLVLFLFGVRRFIDVIGLTGAFAIGGEAIIIVFLYREFLEKKFSQKMNPLLYLLIGVFVLGIIFEVIYFLSARI